MDASATAPDVTLQPDSTRPFSGFAVYWEIPASEPTAKVGEWVKAPIEAFMHAMHRQFVQLPIIAEDLGAKAADIQPYLRHYGIPGMRVIQFGFGARYANLDLCGS